MGRLDQSTAFFRRGRNKRFGAVYSYLSIWNSADLRGHVATKPLGSMEQGVRGRWITGRNLDHYD